MQTTGIRSTQYELRLLAYICHLLKSTYVITPINVKL